MNIKRIKLEVPERHRAFIRVLLVQMPFGQPPWRILHWLVTMTEPDFIVFPEYAWYGPGEFPSVIEAGKSAYAELCRVSSRWPSFIIGGTFIEKRSGDYYSFCPLLYRGEEYGRYYKVNPTGVERRRGIQGGDTLVQYQWHCRRFSILICADIFRKDLIRQLGDRGTRLIFVPTASPFRPADTPQAKYTRDRRFFQAGAEIIQGVLVKVCGVGRLFEGRFQGRSLVVTSRQVLWRAAIEDESRMILSWVDIYYEDSSGVHDGEKLKSSDE